MYKTFLEDTSSGDIASYTPKMKMSKVCETCGQPLNESPVGVVGRTDSKSALAHLSPDLKKRFRKLLKDVGGKTVIRYLLADTPLQERNLSRVDICSNAEQALDDLSTIASKRLRDAIENVYDIMDTDC